MYHIEEKRGKKLKKVITILLKKKNHILGHVNTFCENEFCFHFTFRFLKIFLVINLTKTNRLVCSFRHI